MSHHEYTVLYAKRKPWGQSVARWRQHRKSAFGITPSPFGGWYWLTNLFGPNAYWLLSRRKPWAISSLVSRREGRPFK